jgi:hypothetical protein
MKKDAYYFSHDSNAQDDPKCMLLIDQLGMEGYGIFWALIEKLRAEKEYKLPLTVCNAFSRRWSTSKEKIEVVIKSFDLFVIDENGMFFSLRLCQSMNEKTEKARLSANYRWNKDAIALQTDAIALQSDAIKVKESKEKEIKLKESKENIILQKQNNFKLDIWNNFKDQYSKDLLKEFCNYWIEPNKSRTKLKWEYEKTWDAKLRLIKWESNSHKFNKTPENKNKSYIQQIDEIMKDI